MLVYMCVFLNKVSKHYSTCGSKLSPQKQRAKMSEKWVSGSLKNITEQVVFQHNSLRFVKEE